MPLNPDWLISGNFQCRYGHDSFDQSEIREVLWTAFTGIGCVLMDVQMTVMGGFEATAFIRAWEKEHGGHLPIVAMTASRDGRG